MRIPERMQRLRPHEKVTRLSCCAVVSRLGLLVGLLAFCGGVQAQEFFCPDHPNNPHLPAGHGLMAGQIPNCVISGMTTTINLQVPTVIYWDRFSVNPGQTLRFAAANPGAPPAVLNRDLSAGQTRIFGNLVSDGRLILLKPQGSIVVQPGATIDAGGGFTASTLEVDDENALLAGGEDVDFQGVGDSTITNLGTIRAGGGDVVLVSGTVNNVVGGSILAPSGRVRIGAGSHVRLAASGEPRILVLDGVDGRHSALNTGLIEGLEVEISAFQATSNPDAPSQSIDNQGVIRATAPGGRVFLRATPDGEIFNGPDGVIIGSLQVEGSLLSTGTLIDPDDGSNNPTATSAARQFPRLSTGTLAAVPSADLRPSSLSFSHLNGLDSKKKRSREGAESQAVAVRGARGGGADEEAKKPTTAASRKIVMRRGTFFGKQTASR